MSGISYTTDVRPEWIDYNGHMQDAYYGLIFSYAVDGVQDAVGFDDAYRRSTGCSVYVVEDHKFFLREVKLGAQLTVITQVLGVDAKRFHLHMTMQCDGQTVAICEAMELHVSTKPAAKACEMPPDIRARLQAAQLDAEAIRQLPHRARAFSALS